MRMRMVGMVAALFGGRMLTAGLAAFMSHKGQGDAGAEMPTGSVHAAAHEQSAAPLDRSATMPAPGTAAATPSPPVANPAPTTPEPPGMQKVSAAEQPHDLPCNNPHALGVT